MRDRKIKIFLAVIGTISFVAGFYLPGCVAEAEAEPQKLKADIHKPTLTAPDVSKAFEVKAAREVAKKVIDTNLDIREAIDSITFPTEEMVLTSLGTYYITGYTSIECGGSTTTASGATCHKGNPTTCAIDPKIHDFGDLFYIAEFDQVYVAEDTGSAVKGKHLDLYFWDDEYNYALSITGYYEVFAVEYVYGEELASKYNIQALVAKEGGLEWN